MNKLAPDCANYISWKCDLIFYKMIGIGGLFIPEEVHECKRQIKNKAKVQQFSMFSKVWMWWNDQKNKLCIAICT